MAEPKDFDHLDLNYRFAQSDRVLAMVGEVQNRGVLVGPGRTVPDEQNQVIGTGRQFKAAVLFLDISGFSSIPNDFEDEQERVLFVMQIFFAEALRILIDYGGHVEKNTGDGLLAYFSASSQDSVTCTQRAVAAALTIFNAAKEVVGPALNSAGHVLYPFRMSIDFGTLTVARVGAPYLYNGRVAIGTAANVTAKLLNIAKAGDLILGERAFFELPFGWQQNCELVPGAETGFSYREDGRKYPCWRCIKRWSDPVITEVVNALMRPGS